MYKAILTLIILANVSSVSALEYLRDTKVSSLIVRSADFVEESQNSWVSVYFDKSLSLSECPGNQFYIFSDKDTALFSSLLTAKASNENLDVAINNSKIFNTLCKIEILISK